MNIRRWLKVYIIGFVMFGIGNWAIADDYGDIYTNAAPLTLGTLTSGVLETNSDVDYFWFTGEADTMYSAVVWNKTDNGDYTDVGVSDENDYGIGGGSGPSLLFSTTDAGRYHIHCSAYDWATYPMGYRLLVKKQSFVSAPVGTTLSGRLVASNEVDGFSFLSDTGKTYAVVLGTGNADNLWNHRMTLSGQDWFKYPGQAVLVSVDNPQMQYGIVYDRDGAVASASYSFRSQEITFTDMVGGEGSGRISSAWKMDGFSMPVEGNWMRPAKYAAWITTPGDPWNYRISCFDENSSSRANGNWNLTFSVWDNQSYKFVVTSQSAESQDYVLHVQSYVDDLPDNPWDEPPYIAPIDGSTTSAAIQVPGDFDAIKFVVQKGKSYVFGASFVVSNDYRFSVNFYDENNNALYNSRDRKAGCFTATEDGTNTMVISYNSDSWSGPHPYGVQITEFTDDNDNNPNSPNTITVGAAPVSGDFKILGDVDWFNFNLIKGKRYILTAGLNKYYCIYNSPTSDDQYWTTTSSGGDSITFTANRTGLVRGFVKCLPGGIGSYQISIKEDVDLPNFVIESVVLAPDGVASSSVMLSPDDVASGSLMLTTSPGQKVTAYVEVSNLGRIGGNAGYLGVYMDMPGDPGTNMPTKKVSVGIIDSRHSKMVKIPGLVVPSGSGEKAFCAFVDCMRTVHESVESDNCGYQSYTVTNAYANLIVTDISWSPARPTPGASMTGYVTVQNVGTIATDGGMVALWTNHPDPNVDIGVETNWTKKIAVGKLLPLQQKRMVFSGLKAPMALGTNTFVAYVDCLQKVPESIETDNECNESYVVEVKYINFVIPEIQLDPEQPVAGQKFTARVTVLNNGTWAGNAGQVKLWIVSTNAINYTSRVDRVSGAGTLAAGQSKVVSFSGLTGPVAGSHVLTAAVNFGPKDACSYPGEMDREDNVATLPYETVRAYADYAVRFIWMGGNNPFPGKTFAAYVGVWNVGTISGDAGYLDIWVTNSVGKATRSQAVGTLKPNVMKVVTFTSLTAPRTPGTYDFKAVINSRSNSTEAISARDNNTLIDNLHVVSP